MKIGCINKITNITEYEYTSNRIKNLGGKFGKEPYVQYIISEGKKSDMYTYNSDNNSVELTNEYEIIDPNTKKVKIYKYISNTSNYNLFNAPIDVDYNTGLTTTLFPKRHFIQGELQKVEWFSDKELTDLVIQVDVEYQRDSLGFAFERTTTRTWYREDGTEALPKKITVKSYSNDMLSQIDEGIRRRGNIVKGLQMPVLGGMLATIPAREGESEQERQGRVLKTGRRFLANYKEWFTLFSEDSNKEIIEQITLADDYWLDNVIDINGTTIRNFMINELSIDEPV